MAAHLAPCPGCARHVRSTETSCPFCATALDLSSVPPPLVPTARLSRSATLGFQTLLRAGAVAVAAATATNSSSCTVQIYGTPGVEDAGGASGGGSEGGDLGAGAGGEDGSAGSP